ncbi:MAG: (2Fe-2S)-binding protein [Rhodospirillales bacterium]
MSSTKKLWTLLAVLLVASFSVLLRSGNQIYQNAPTVQWLAELFGANELDAAERTALLSGAANNGQADPGRIICSCFAVGLNRLNDAIATLALKSTEEVGALLRAGTNCGACLPEIRALLAEA